MALDTLLYILLTLDSTVTYYVCLYIRYVHLTLISATP